MNSGEAVSLASAGWLHPHGGGDPAALLPALQSFLKSIGSGVMVGLILSFVAQFILRRFVSSPSQILLLGIAVALSSYGLAQLLQGSGFISAYVTGLFLANDIYANRWITPKRLEQGLEPFNTLTVYVGLEQRANDVNIYAAGVMEVNRKVVPNLVIFDASGIAGDMAGKGTLWLSGHFMERKRAAAAAASQRAADHAERVGAGLAQATRAVQHRLSHMWDSLRLFLSVTEQFVGGAL